MAATFPCVLGPLVPTEPLGHYFAGAVYKFVLKDASGAPGFEDAACRACSRIVEIRCYLSVALLWFLARRMPT